MSTTRLVKGRCEDQNIWYHWVFPAIILLSFSVFRVNFGFLATSFGYRRVFLEHFQFFEIHIDHERWRILWSNRIRLDPVCYSDHQVVSPFHDDGMITDYSNFVENFWNKLGRFEMMARMRPLFRLRQNRGKILRRLKWTWQHPSELIKCNYHAIKCRIEIDTKCQKVTVGSPATPDGKTIGGTSATWRPLR